MRNLSFFFFKQKTAYEIGLGIPAEPLFRSQEQRNAAQNVYRSVEHDHQNGLTTFGQFHQHHSQMPRRSEERFSRNAETDLVCRLLLAQKNGFSAGQSVAWLPRRLPARPRSGS